VIFLRLRRGSARLEDAIAMAEVGLHDGAHRHVVFQPQERAKVYNI
jgi:hypothetical protein